MPVEVSQLCGRGIDSTASGDDGEDCSARICGSVVCDLAIAAKSTTSGVPVITALVPMRESVSATTSSDPCTWRMVEVN